MSARSMLGGLALAAMLLSGCRPGPATAGVGPVSAADPGLRGPIPEQPTSGAARIARAIAARWADANAPVPRLGMPIEYRAIDYTATVFSPGSPRGFTAFITTRQTIVVTSASAATIQSTNSGLPSFATSADQALWRVEGRPSLGQAPASGQRLTVPAGAFGFLPQGGTLTYHQAATLPTTPDRLAAEVANHLRRYGGRPPASLMLRQLAYLIATADLTDAARSATWQVLASITGLHTCPAPAADSIGLCAASAGDETIVGVNIGSGAIHTIMDRLTRPSPSYPHVPAGAIVGSTTFLIK